MTTKNELMELLFGNRVLIHNLLVQEAKNDRILARSLTSDEDDTRSALLMYAKHNEELAAKIYNFTVDDDRR